MKCPKCLRQFAARAAVAGVSVSIALVGTGGALVPPALAIAIMPSQIASSSQQVHLGLKQIPAAKDIDAGAVQSWFSDKGRAVVVAHSAKDIPDMPVNEVANVTVGAPLRVMRIDSPDVGLDSRITQSDLWAAAITGSNSGLVGVLGADFSSDQPSNEMVIADPGLAQILADILAGDESLLLVYDDALSAWFTVQEDMVSAADSAGKGIIAGSVPLADFLAQRDRNAGLAQAQPAPNSGNMATRGENSANSSASYSAGTASERLPMLGIVIAALVVIALLLASILWLRWEARHGAAQRLRDNRGEALLEDHSDDAQIAAGSLSVIAVATTGNDPEIESEPKLGKAAGKVRVYRREDKER